MDGREGKSLSPVGLRDDAEGAHGCEHGKSHRQLLKNTPLSALAGA